MVTNFSSSAVLTRTTDFDLNDTHMHKGVERLNVLSFTSSISVKSAENLLRFCNSAGADSVWADTSVLDR